LAAHLANKANFQITPVVKKTFRSEISTQEQLPGFGFDSCSSPKNEQPVSVCFFTNVGKSHNRLSRLGWRMPCFSSALALLASAS